MAAPLRGRSGSVPARRAIARASRPLLLLLAPLLGACSAVGSLGGSAPTEGVIVYHEPTRKGAVRTWVFTSGEGDLVDPGLSDARAGVIGSESNTRSASDAESLRLASRLFRTLPASSTVVLSPEKFADFWSRLDSSGLLDLPSRSDGTPPEDTPYFLLKARGRRFLIERPPLDRMMLNDPRTRDQAERWNGAKKAFVAFLNDLNEQ